MYLETVYLETVSIPTEPTALALSGASLRFELARGSSVTVTPTYLAETDEVQFDIDGSIDLPLPGGNVRISGQNRIVMPRETFQHAWEYAQQNGRIPRLSAFLHQVYGRRPLLTR